MEHQPHAGFHGRRFAGKIDPLTDLVCERQAIASQPEKMIGKGSIGFLKCYDATGDQALKRVADRSDRIVQMSKNQPADHGIKGSLLFELQVVQIALDELDIGNAVLSDGLPSLVEHNSGSFKRDNLAGTSDMLCDEAGDVPQACAQFQHTHSGGKAGVEEETPRYRFKSPGLLRQPLAFDG
jgi:hypothetical protein